MSSERGPFSLTTVFSGSTTTGGKGRADKPGWLRMELRRRRASLIVLACCLGGLCFVAFSSGEPKPKKIEEESHANFGLRGTTPSKWRYLTIVDAGSSGCRAHVFRWRTTATGLEVDPTHNNLKVKPGLSSFAANPADAGASLGPLLDFITAEVPEEERASSPIFLKATAGLRMVDEAPREAILESVRKTIAASPFSFSDPVAGALVIAGTDEGGFGWMSVNYLLGNLDGSVASPAYHGVLEMGGASAQVTQVYDASSGPLPVGYEFEFALGDRHYALYTHSYLGYGLEKAREALSTSLADKQTKKGPGPVKDPCLQRGFLATADASRASVYDGPAGVEVVGAGLASSCEKAVEQALFAAVAKPDAKSERCNFLACSFGGVFQPKALPATTLLAFENFHYTADMLDMPRPASPHDFESGAEAVCDLEWQDLTARGYPKDGSSAEELSKLCFSATYLAAFLEHGVGVKEDTKVKVQQVVGDFGIDWSLGAAIREASNIAKTEKRVRV